MAKRTTRFAKSATFSSDDDSVRGDNVKKYKLLSAEYMHEDTVYHEGDIMELTEDFANRMKAADVRLEEVTDEEVTEEDDGDSS